jgi:hypothetical protein
MDFKVLLQLQMKLQRAHLECIHITQLMDIRYLLTTMTKMQPLGFAHHNITTIHGGMERVGLEIILLGPEDILTRLIGTVQEEIIIILEQYI